MIEGHSDIRWYCVYNQAKQQYRGYEHLAPRVDRLSASNYVAQTVVKLRTALSQPDTLHLQLAVMVDAIDPFVLCCCTMEGDDVGLIFRVYQDWMKLTEHVALCRATALTRTQPSPARSYVSASSG
jgi:hypothetical protein